MEATAQNSIKIQTLHLFFLFFALHFSFSSCSTEIPLGSSLSSSNPNQTWSSPSNTFSLGFLPINSSFYSLAITHSSLSIPTWTPSTAVGGGASFKLLLSGDLRLLTTAGAVVWSSGTANLGVSHATFDDNGNFALKNGSLTVWSSFDHPTDVIVQSQNFSSEMNFTSGSYSFALTKTGNLTLTWNNTVQYYTLGLNSSVNANLTSPYLSLIPTGILVLSDPNLSAPVNIAYSSDYSDTSITFRFLRLDSDGNLRIYSSTGAVGWSAVSDQCMVFGYCGNMGICSYNETGPICGCPSLNFEMVDVSNARKGCKLSKELKDCPLNQTMLRLDHTQFLINPSIETVNEVFYMGITACSGNSLTGNAVAATSYGDGSGQCYTIFPSEVASGYRSTALPSTSFVKVCAPGLPNQPPNSEQTIKKAKTHGWIISLVAVIAFLCSLLLEGSLWWWCCGRKNANFGGGMSMSLSGQYSLLEYASGAPVQFSYKQLRHATKGFKEKLGEGGFGAVYKGILTNRTQVAVKQLEGIEQGEKHFRMEVATISSTHHLNLVRLIGFCSEGRHRLLVYEYMKNSSLDTFLFPKTQQHEKKLLSWEQRFNVALGTARGITYLHEECRDCIVHCDIKPENILLDDDCNAKVSDFGLAKLMNPKEYHKYQSLVSVRGTRGYLAPEWIANLPITSKSDVYSFGMVLLEMVSGRRNFEVSEETDRKKFSSWAYEEFNKGHVERIVDRRLSGGSERDMEQVRRVIQVGFWCIQEQPSQRPMMGKVVQMLEGVLDVEKPPPPKSTGVLAVVGHDTYSSMSSLTSRYLSSGSRMNAGGSDITDGSVS